MDRGNDVSSFFVKRDLVHSFLGLNGHEVELCNAQHVASANWSN